MLEVDDPEGNRFKFRKPVLKTIPSQPLGGPFPRVVSQAPPVGHSKDFVKPRLAQVAVDQEDGC